MKRLPEELRQQIFDDWTTGKYERLSDLVKKYKVSGTFISNLLKERGVVVPLKPNEVDDAKKDQIYSDWSTGDYKKGELRKKYGVTLKVINQTIKEKTPKPKRNQPFNWTCSTLDGTQIHGQSYREVYDEAVRRGFNPGGIMISRYGSAEMSWRDLEIVDNRLPLDESPKITKPIPVHGIERFWLNSPGKR